MNLAILIVTEAILPLAAAGDPVAAFDLRRMKPSVDCADAGAAEIVVCGRPAGIDSQRLGQLDPGDYAPQPLRAEMAIGKVTASTTVEQRQFSGATSNRVMMNLKLPF